MKKYSLLLLRVMIILTGIASCKKETATPANNTPANSTPANKKPIANAGPDQEIMLPNNTVTLDGSGSTDPDNNIRYYHWAKLLGPASFNFSNADAVQTTVTLLTEGNYLFELKVTDAGGLFSMDTVQVSVMRQNNSTLDIYVTGSENGMAKYWKNGQEVILGNEFAASIAVAGNDVYVAGGSGDWLSAGSNRAKYWKNGQEVLLNITGDAFSSSIAVDGGDVYVAGWEYSGTKTVAKYWKNRQAVSLTNGLTDAEATCIIVVGGNVYVSGNENGVAKYWKNGQPVSITNGSQQAYANSIAVVGNDIYVAGSESNVAKYWKNGQAISLTNGSAIYATANDIAVVGNDVYVAGWEGDFAGRVGGSGSVAKYWKNGQEISLSNGTTYAQATSISIYGSDVYVAGYEGTATNKFAAKYWKNGQAVALSGANGSFASDIFIVKR